MAHIFRVTLSISDVRRKSPGWSVDHHFPHPICEPWCWYIDLQNWVILFRQMLVNIPYMEHMGMTIAILRHPPCLDNPMCWKPCCSFRHVWPYEKRSQGARSRTFDDFWIVPSLRHYIHSEAFLTTFLHVLSDVLPSPRMSTHLKPRFEIFHSRQMVPKKMEEVCKSNNKWPALWTGTVTSLRTWQTELWLTDHWRPKKSPVYPSDDIFHGQGSILNVGQNIWVHGQAKIFWNTLGCI